MKDNLFEMLMSFFEKTLSQIKERQSPEINEDDSSEQGLDIHGVKIIQAAKRTSMRIFTSDEQMKFTKASQQFLTRMMLWGVLAEEVLEPVMTQLLFSDSRFVTLQETKWTIRNTLAPNLDTVQLAFLDLVLYQKEDELPLH